VKSDRWRSWTSRRDRSRIETEVQPISARSLSGSVKLPETRASVENARVDIVWMLASPEPASVTVPATVEAGREDPRSARGSQRDGGDPIGYRLLNS